MIEPETPESHRPPGVPERDASDQALGIAKKQKVIFEWPEVELVRRQGGSIFGEPDLEYYEW